MNRPKICFVALTIYPVLKQEAQLQFIGGAEVQQMLIGRELNRRGYDVSYITMDHGQGAYEKLGPFEVLSTFRETEGIPVVRFLYPRLQKIWQALRHSDADIYYVRTAGFILAPVVYYARENHKKVVFCGADDPDFDPQKVRVRTWRDKLLYFWGLRRTNAIIVQNRLQRQLLQAHFQKDARLIYNGFPAKQPAPSHRSEILWVANFRNPKNPHLFLKLAKQFPDEKFVMIGGKSKDKDGQQRNLYEAMKAEAAKIPNLEFTGFLPLTEVEKRFRKAKLFVNTSEHEGFPNTFLQAWSQGIPVISFVDPDDLIRKNRLGLVVRDVEDMARGIREVLQGKIYFSEQVIRACFDQHFRIEAVVDQYTALFEALVNGNGIHNRS